MSCVLGWLGRTLGATVLFVLALAIAGTSAADKTTAGPDIKTFADGLNSMDVVDYGSRISLFVESTSASFVLESLRDNMAGPTFTSLEPLSRPVTLAVHRMPIEDVLRRMLQGYNYTLAYHDGRISHVRVLHMIPGRNYKTPRAVETRSQWQRIEKGEEAPRIPLQWPSREGGGGI